MLAQAPVFPCEIRCDCCSVYYGRDPVFEQWRCLIMMLRPDCVQRTAHLINVRDSSLQRKVDVVVLSITTFVCKAPARHAHVLTLSSFAKHQTVYLVPVVAQKLVGAVATNSSATHKLERAKHIPVLCQQVINQSLSLLSALFICHARLRMYLSTRQENPAEMATQR